MQTKSPRIDSLWKGRESGGSGVFPAPDASVRPYDRLAAGLLFLSDTSTRIHTSLIQTSSRIQDPPYSLSEMPFADGSFWDFGVQTYAAGFLPSETGFFLWAFIASLIVTAMLLVELNRGKRREHKLYRSRNHFRFLAENTADMLLVIDHEYKVVFASPSVETHLGYSPWEIMGDKWDNLHGTSCSIEKLLQRADEEGKRCETDLRTKDGRLVQMETMVSLVRDRNAKFVGMTAVFRDISWRKKAEDALQEEMDRFRSIFTQAADAMVIINDHGQVVMANKAALDLFQKDLEQLRRFRLGRPAILESSLTVDIITGKGEHVVAEVSLSKITWQQQEAHLVAMRDVTERKKIEEELRRSEERYRMVADYNYDLECWIGPDGSVLYISPSCTRITGYSQDEFKDVKSFEKLIHTEHLDEWKHFMRERADTLGSGLDIRIIRKDTQERWVSQVNREVFASDGEPMGIRCSMRDITERKVMEMQLRHHALHDPLTGLANRTLCLEIIQNAVERAKTRDDSFYAVAFMDLDRFKIINDSMGHAFGDKVLIEFTKRMLDNVRSVDTVSRYGGDEFVFVLEELDSQRDAVRIMKKIRSALTRPFIVDDHEIRLTVTMGIVLGPTDYSHPEYLLQNANIAMHRAKEKGPDKLQVFNSKMYERVMQRMTLERDLRKAVENNEIFLKYQPIMDLKTGKAYGFEALARWNHPERGIIGAGDFIHVAEDSGQMRELGTFILHEALTAYAGWMRRPGFQDVLLSVNISARQFSGPGLIETVRTALRSTGVPPDRLKLEITETTIMEDVDTAGDKLKKLKELGVALSIDDFGTGYSSMSYLQRFPLDNLKIDLSFIRVMDIAPENIEIIKAVIGLAHNLELRVTAEGIEREIQRQTLIALGCEYGQGFLFARPMPAEEVPEFIDRLEIENAEYQSESA